MKAATAMPYRSSSPGRLTGGAWDIASVGYPLATRGGGIEIDYLSKIEVHRQLVIDTIAVRRDCGLDDQTPLLISANWSSPGTSIKRCFAKAAVGSGNDAERIDLFGQIPGGEVADSLQIDTLILLGRNNPRAPALTAKYAGSVLLRERHTVRLDESGSRFPVEVVDFNVGVWANPQAGWRLSWNSSDLDAPFLRTVRLFVNAAHHVVTNAVAIEPPSPEAKAIRDAIYFDVATSLIFGALMNDEFVSREGGYSEGSCGRAIYTLIQLLFPGDALSGLKSAATQRPDQFSSDLQGRLRIFHE
ncbi:hypothetical protein [Burkholderia stagnalis]|uniref:hypothetical protein n=1 Tax=Burkholderia stagnalis TaxID=1503054 RepID=UPI000B2F66DB|nr:hypothetical protein [Burkholderia stagnalis]